MKSYLRYLTSNKLCIVDAVGMAAAGAYLGQGGGFFGAIAIGFLGLIVGFVLEEFSR